MLLSADSILVISGSRLWHLLPHNPVQPGAWRPEVLCRYTCAWELGTPRVIGGFLKNEALALGVSEAFRGRE